MNIFKHEFNSSIKSTLIWVIATVIFIIVSMVKGDGFIGNSEANELMQSLPSGVVALFGMSNLDVSTFSGYYGVVYLYLAITVSIFSILTINNSLVGESVDHVTEYIYSKPISKKVIAYSKIGNALFRIFIYQGLVLLLTLSYFKATGELDSAVTIINMHFHAFLISLLFFGITLIVIMLKNNLSSSMLVSFGLLFGFYLLETVNQLLDLGNWFSYLSPFIFFSATNIINYNFNLIYYLICLIPLIVGLILTNYNFVKKEF